MTGTICTWGMRINLQGYCWSDRWCMPWSRGVRLLRVRISFQPIIVLAYIYSKCWWLPHYGSLFWYLQYRLAITQWFVGPNDAVLGWLCPYHDVSPTMEKVHSDHKKSSSFNAKRTNDLSWYGLSSIFAWKGPATTLAVVSTYHWDC